MDPRSPGYRRGTTDAAGRYVLSGVYAGRGQPIFVSKPGFVSVFETVDITGSAVKDFALRPGVIVSGKILEAGVGPLNGVTVSVITGPDAGVQATTALLGGFGLPPVRPGDFTIRASKAGYDSVDIAVHAAVNTWLGEITMKWAYGSCLSSVAPVLFDRVAAAGQTGSVRVETLGNRPWTARPDVPWVNIVTNASATGSGTLQFQVLPNSIGALDGRSGAIQIRCADGGGQNIWITQMVDCQTTISPDANTPAVFPAEGGNGHLFVQFGVPGCRSRDYSDVDWAFLAGVSSYISHEAYFGVLRNTTGRPRTGVLVIGEARYVVKQD